MRKNFYLSGLFLCILALCICGCGGGGGSAADPMGTGTVQFVDGSGSVLTSATVTANGAITLTAKVSNLDSKGTSVPVVNEKVSFSIVTAGNGASLSVVDDRTGSGGLATVLYTAANSNYVDTVQVTTDVGATATILITVSGAPNTTRIIDTLTASSTTVVAGQTSVITAKVVDGTSSPVMGVLIMFTLPVNNSGASFINASGVSVSSISISTDASGNAEAIYKAGSVDPFKEVSDIILGALTNGSSKAVEIKRSAPTDLSVSVAAAPTSVAAGQASIITATVTGDNKAYAAVTFTLPVNESGASFINAAGVYVSSVSVNTDATGNAVAIYLAGSSSPLTAVYDTVRATLANGSGNAVVITRSAGTAPPTTTDLSVTLAAAPTSVAALQTSIVTATVAGDNKSGAAVTFTIPVNMSGASFINASGSSVASITVTASGTGTATALYQAGSVSPGIAVQDTVQAVLANGANAAIILTRTSATTSYYAVAIVPSETSVTAGQVSIITATVTVSGTTPGPAGGVPVAFTLPVNSSGATLSAATATTDSSGKVVVIYQPGTTNPTVTVQDTVQAAVGSATSAVAIERKGSATTAFSITIGTPVPATLEPTHGGSSVITANVTNNAGAPISGVTVNFSIVNGSLSTTSSITDGNGNAVTVFTAGAGTTKTTAGVVTASITVGNTYTAAVVITYQ